MIAYVDKKVKIFLKNGMAPEGLVISWSAKEVLLKSDENDCTLVIYYPSENIVMTKVYEERLPLTREERDALREKVKTEFDEEYKFSEPVQRETTPEFIVALKNRSVSNSYIYKLERENERISTQRKDEDAATHHELHVENIENLVDLHKAKAKAERNQVVSKLKNFYPNPAQVMTGKYVPPYSKK